MWKTTNKTPWQTQYIGGSIVNVICHNYFFLTFKDPTDKNEIRITKYETLNLGINNWNYGFTLKLVEY